MIATEYCKKVFDGTHDSPKPVENGRLLITSKHIANRNLDISSAYLISEEDFENVNKRSQVHQWDILFSMIGTVGNVYIETSEKIDYAIKNMGVFSCQNKEKAYWLYYYLQSPLVQAKIDALMAGAVQKFVPLGFLRDLDIPEYTENSKKVVQVLSALDDKIALNKKMNQKLEAMAKRLYDYWFVQYDFPDKNGRPYKTTGGSMTYNPILKREIPAGWEVSSFTDFGFFKNGINYDKNEIGDETVKIVNVRNISDSTTYFNIDELDDITLKSDDIQKFVATPKDILLARSGSPGATRLLPQTDKKIIYCGFIIRYQLNEQDLDKQLYLFHVLKGYEQVTSTQSAGSILKNISQDTLNALMVVMPQSSVLDAFNKKIAPIYSMLRKNISELNKLTILRDKLLPLLMNGQVVVG